MWFTLDGDPLQNGCPEKASVEIPEDAGDSTTSLLAAAYFYKVDQPGSPG